jgi:hypothetical protein
MGRTSRRSRRIRILFSFPLFLVAGFSAPATAQVGEGGNVPADPEDVASVDAIVAAVYDVISGPAGEARDWDRFRSLFLPGARLIPVGVQPGGEYAANITTPEEYAERADAFFLENGFFEAEIGRVEERFGPIVHRFSAYASKRSLADAEPFARGINSFQLMHDGTRWWVVTIYWTAERPDLPIPEKYLGAPSGL